MTLTLEEKIHAIETGDFTDEQREEMMLKLIVELYVLIRLRCEKPFDFMSLPRIEFGPEFVFTQKHEDELKPTAVDIDTLEQLTRARRLREQRDFPIPFTVESDPQYIKNSRTEDRHIIHDYKDYEHRQSIHRSRNEKDSTVYPELVRPPDSDWSHRG